MYFLVNYENLILVLSEFFAIVVLQEANFISICCLGNPGIGQVV